MTDINQAEIARVFNAAPFIAELGLRLDVIAPGECRTSLVLAERHLQHDGYVHAGVQATMADHTAGIAATTLLGIGQVALTAQCTIHLLRSAKGDHLSCFSRVLKAGSKITIVESEVFCGAEEATRLVSKATITLAIVRPRSEP